MKTWLINPEQLLAKKTYLFVFKLGQEEINVFGYIQFIFPTVSHQVSVENIICLHKYPCHVTEMEVNVAIKFCFKRKSHYPVNTLMQYIPIFIMQYH